MHGESHLILDKGKDSNPRHPNYDTVNDGQGVNSLTVFKNL